MDERNTSETRTQHKVSIGGQQQGTQQGVYQSHFQGMSPLAGKLPPGTTPPKAKIEELDPMETADELIFDTPSIHSSEELAMSMAETTFSPPSDQMPSVSGSFEQLRQVAFRTTILPRLATPEDGQNPQLLVESRQRYEKAKALGQGAMGDVELVFDRDINRFVAVKRLKKELHSPQPLLRFAEEVRVVGQLEHPNIVPIHDVGLDANGHYYFVMKYIEGETLEDIIAKLKAGDQETHKRYTYVRRTQIFLDILKAMAFAHDKGIIHRDIKPANIMIGPHGEVMVMDWGIAKQLPAERRNASRMKPQEKPSNSLLAQLENDPAFQTETARFDTHSGTLMGTPAYMSPEQAAGANAALDERSDIYSLCVLFYEFMGLQHYLAHKQSVHDLLFAIFEETPQPPFGLRNPHQQIVPIEYSHFISRGLQKSPKERWQNINEMMHELERIQAGYIKIQCPTTLMKRSLFSVLHFVDRFPSLAYLVIVGLLAIGAYTLAAKLLGI